MITVCLALQVGDRVMVDGGHGEFCFPLANGATNRPSSHVLCIAGGIGITPIRSIAEEVIRSSDKALTVVHR